VKVLVDMNLAPAWCDALRSAGFEARHWRDLGDPRAPDLELLRFAARGGWVILTHDLDFTAMLAATGDGAPSIVQLRSRNILPGACSAAVVAAIRLHSADLIRGAILSVEASGTRLRELPIA
jgi:predicted nuclease of predicted toxin-antitoxin system